MAASAPGTVDDHARPDWLKRVLGIGFGGTAQSGADLALHAEFRQANAEEGIDDVQLELLKLATLREISGAPLNDESELRLADADGDTLGLDWIVSETQQPLSSLALPRAMLAGIAAHVQAWAPLCARLAEALFVDLGRLLLTQSAEYG